MNTQRLHNIIWQSLSGAHAKYSSGTNTARRYAPGFSPIIGFADAEHPDFVALAPYCEPDAHFYCGGWSGPVPSGWHLHADTLLNQLVWDASAFVPAADDALVAVRLGAEHVRQILDLVAITQPGPFGPRTSELGEYFGVFDGERLVAMAGERMEAGPLREVSGVCTHPDFQGRGLARRLIAHLVRRELRRNQTPFLHVMHDNLHARRLYERIGFRHLQDMVVRVVSREP
jgi:GNAT superfamily N-acetyltransferase